MKLTLYLDWYGKDDDDLKKQQKVIIDLPNKDGFHLFEAWIHLSRCNSVSSEIIDRVIESFYDIVMEAVQDRLGLTERDHYNGRYDITDPIAEDEDNMSAIVSLYLDKRYHE